MSDGQCLPDYAVKEDKILIYFHEKLLGTIKLDASSREAGQDLDNIF
jgi:hypothetical protein